MGGEGSVSHYLERLALGAEPIDNLVAKNPKCSSNCVHQHIGVCICGSGICDKRKLK